MAQSGTLFFVVRTDISADSGVNRCFATCDAEDEATLLMAELQASMGGVFAVYPGAPLAVGNRDQVTA